MRILVTGASGSCGSYLLEEIQKVVPGAYVVGTQHTLRRALPPEWFPGVDWRRVDLRNRQAVEVLVRRVAPLDLVFHLAADADVRASFDHPTSLIETNVLSTLYLLDALRVNRQHPTVLIASTPEVYGGSGPRGIAGIPEDARVEPSNPYAAGKLASEAIAFAYARSYQIPIVVTRGFGYVNPRRRNLVLSAVAYQIAEAEKHGDAEAIVRHGNLKSIRTFTDVRDIVKAYWLAATQAKADGLLVAGPFNIGSETPRVLSDIVAWFQPLTPAKLTFVEVGSLLRPVDIDSQVPDCTRFHRWVGWTPAITFEESLRWLMAKVRRLVGVPGAQEEQVP